MHYETSKYLSPEAANHPEFRSLSASLIDDLTHILDERLVQHADVFMPEEEDPLAWSSFRDLALVQLASYLIQKPVSQNEVIDNRLLNHEMALRFYSGTNSPVDEKGELEQLREENIRLKEELAIASMRRTATRHRGCPKPETIRSGAISGAFNYA